MAQPNIVRMQTAFYIIHKNMKKTRHSKKSHLLCCFWLGLRFLFLAYKITFSSNLLIEIFSLKSTFGENLKAFTYFASSCSDCASKFPMMMKKRERKTAASFLLVGCAPLTPQSLMNYSKEIPAGEWNCNRSSSRRGEKWQWKEMRNYWKFTTRK